MLNDIKAKHGSLGNPRRSGGQAASSSSRAEVKAETEGTPSGQSTQSDARRRADKVFAKSKAAAAEADDEAKTAAEGDEEARGRSPVRNPNKTRKRSSSSARQVTLQSAAETLELKPAKGKKRTRSTREEAYRSRKDIIGYIDPKFVRQRRWKIEFDVQKNISGDDIDMLFQEEEDTGKTRSHRTYIGPGADGCSNDKIIVELRYHSKDNKLTFDPGMTTSRTRLSSFEAKIGDVKKPTLQSDRSTTCRKMERGPKDTYSSFSHQLSSKTPLHITLRGKTLKIVISISQHPKISSRSDQTSKKTRKSP